MGQRGEKFFLQAGGVFRLTPRPLLAREQLFALGLRALLLGPVPRHFDESA
jgi:hypothetical protein